MSNSKQENDVVETDVALIKARVLINCGYGTVNDVVELSPNAIKAGVALGVLDPSEDAVAYASSLKA